jgi:hypothetical protein
LIVAFANSSSLKHIYYQIENDHIFMKYSPVGFKNAGYHLRNYSKSRRSDLMQIGGKMASLRIGRGRQRSKS